MRSIVDYVMIFKGRGLKMGVFVGGGGGGGLTWTLILRIFGMVSITFFFAPPSPFNIFYKSKFGDLVHLITYVLPSNEALPHKLTLSLHLNQHFNLTIISYNS